MYHSQKMPPSETKLHILQIKPATARWNGRQVALGLSAASHSHVLAEHVGVGSVASQRHTLAGWLQSRWLQEYQDIRFRTGQESS